MRRLFVSALLVAALAAPAAGYVRTRSSKGQGTPSYWPASCVFLLPAADGSIDLPADRTFDIIRRSVARWVDPTRGCAYLALHVDEPAEADAHYDGKNVIKFRADRWCHPNDKQHTEVCYAPEAAAITSVFMINEGGPDDGLILDADIELNQIWFTFVELMPGQGVPTPTRNAPDGDPTAVADLENTLVHELGHLVGLSHTCRDRASFPNDVDENGNPPPPCNTIDQLPFAEQMKIKQATMYNFADTGEDKKRTPEPDDIAGFCAAYPIASPREDRCEQTDLARYTTRGACQVTPRVSLAAPLLLLLAAGLLVARRRRRG